MDKKPYERARKVSVSMPGLLADDAETEQRRLRLPTFSDYIQHCIRLQLEAAARRPQDLAAMPVAA